MSKRLRDVRVSLDPYDLKSKDRLKKNLTRKFNKIMGASLYQFETLMRDVIANNPEVHKDFKSELFRIGNRMIQNMKKEVDCYNVTYVPITMEMRGPDGND